MDLSAPLLYIKDQSYKTLLVVDRYESLIWHKCYYESGDFEIYLPVDLYGSDVFSLDYYVTRGDDDMVGIIEKISIAANYDGVDYITITGRDASSILQRRVKQNHKGATGDAMALVRGFISDECINSGTERQMPIELGSYVASGDRITKFWFGKDVYTTIQGLCETHEIGFKMPFNSSKNGFRFDLYKGEDFTGSKKRVVFSSEYSNLLSSESSLDKTEFGNVAFVAGEGEGEERKTALVGETQSAGLERYEVYSDSRNTRMEDTSKMTEEEKEKALADYQAGLESEGVTLLTEHALDESVGASITDSGQFSYKKDYELGDIIVINTGYGRPRKARIIGITEGFDENGHSVEPELKIKE